MVDSVYGNVRHFCDTMLKRFDVQVEYYDPAIGSEIETLDVAVPDASYSSHARQNL